MKYILATLLVTRLSLSPQTADLQRAQAEMSCGLNAGRGLSGGGSLRFALEIGISGLQGSASPFLLQDGTLIH